LTATSLRERFERCIAGGGIVLFPSDTVYGLACAPDDAEAVQRLYELKDRPVAKSAAVMFFDLRAALDALPELGQRTRSAMTRLLPGGVTLLLPNPARRFPLACAADPDTLGIRVVSVPELTGVATPVLQSSANLAGGHDPCRLEDVAGVLRSGVDLEIDGGELPGTASTVVDLRHYEDGGPGAWTVVRVGAVSEGVLAAALDGQYHFDPSTYEEMIHADIPVFDELQDTLAEVSVGREVRRILDLGTGTGETARRLLARYPDAELVGVDESAAMLEEARRALPAGRVSLRAARLQDPLPEGPFDLVASALCIHHLYPEEKADLFHRVRQVVAGGGAFVIADVVVPDDPGQARIGLTPDYDRPSTASEHLSWLAQVGFAAHVLWQEGDLAVFAAHAPG
jgi:tRNA threonylcarbamoyl adenosine modification protein (Sua5/YciO/YrdC/YwlC family)